MTKLSHLSKKGRVMGPALFRSMLYLQRLVQNTLSRFGTRPCALSLSLADLFWTTFLS